MWPIFLELVEIAWIQSAFTIDAKTVDKPEILRLEENKTLIVKLAMVKRLQVKKIIKKFVIQFVKKFEKKNINKICKKISV